MIRFATSIFWAAFLLFVVQPLTARRLLPLFGGAPAVWIVTLLFFQLLLLAGYAYAHLVSRRLDHRGQAWAQGGLVVAGLLVLLASSPPRPPASSDADPTAGILGWLVVSLGVPVLALAASSPLLQRWLVPTYGAAGGRSVYRLFALSNLGSLLGLWCYPFALEPFVPLASQERLWMGGYAVFAVATLACARAVRRTPFPRARSSRLDEPWTSRPFWILLSATGAALLMSTSNQLTRNVAAVPFLWVLPLSLYLVSFILSFESPRWYVRPVWAAVYLASLAGILRFLSAESEPSLTVQLVVYSANLLSGCMICHGELARRRPRASGLTGFYLYVAAGGALGGLFVSLLAPRWFEGYWEFPLALACVYLLGGIAMPLPLKARVFWAAGAVSILVVLVGQVQRTRAGARLMARSFYGVVRVYDRFAETEDWERYLWNGPVAHGGQLLAEGRRGTPILYYGSHTGVALALDFEPDRPKRVGVVGLGTGSLAAYGRPSDRYRFYELSPDVVSAAREHFTYLDDSAAEVEVVLGDGRLRLSEEDSQRFDVLVLDAFTGDAIPVHLLTVEAFEIYRRHLAPGGILAVHVSNLHFDLEPVVRAQAEGLGLVSVLVQSDADESLHQFVSDWVLVTDNATFLSDAAVARRMAPRLAGAGGASEPLRWTDDHASLFAALR